MSPELKTATLNKSCKNCAFHLRPLKKCSLTAESRQNWDCCGDHEVRK